MRGYLLATYGTSHCIHLHNTTIIVEKKKKKKDTGMWLGGHASRVMRMTVI